MKEKLKCILLVDDDSLNNFLNELIIRKSGSVEKTVVVQNAKQALAYLQSVNEENPVPDLILLDIEMPGLDGWEFLHEYRNLPLENKDKIVVAMLSTSINPADEQRVAEYSEVKEFCRKPMSKDALKNLLQKYFPQLL